MTDYVNFSSMSSLERHVFQTTGQCDKQFHMGESEFNHMVDEIVHKQVMQQQQELAEEQV